MRKMKKARVPRCCTRAWKFAVICVSAGKEPQTSTEYRHVRKQLHCTVKSLTSVQSCGSEFFLWIQLSGTLPKTGEQLPGRVRIDLAAIDRAGVGAHPCVGVIWKALSYHWVRTTKEETEFRAFILRSVVLELNIYRNVWVEYPHEYR